MYILPDATIVERQTTDGPGGQQPPSTPSPPPASTSSDQHSGQIWTYVVAGVVGFVVLVIAIIFVYTTIRKLKVTGRSPKYLPTKFLKRKWQAWQPQGKYSNLNRNRNRSRDQGETEAGSVALTTNEQTTETAGVNRNTSVRSVMTLPGYSQKPKDGEEVIAREGERGGIDTVLELPETIEEEEDRREQEMESLYQIRQARRREIAERDERRRERREARERGDYARLEELRRESRQRREQHSLANLAQNSASNVNLTAEMLIVEHNSRGRDKRVSSVSYAQLGQVRHDGSRIRSNSHDSERSGLLNGAAPMGSHTRNASEATLLSLGGLPQPRYRDRSDSAATTVSTTASSFENVALPSDAVRPTTSRTIGSVSDLSEEDADISGQRIVVTEAESSTPHPPEYDGHDWGDAPEYTENSVSRANSSATTRPVESINRSPSIVSRTDTLSIVTPSIYIQTPTGPNTPVVREAGSEPQSPVSPISPQQTRRL